MRNKGLIYLVFGKERKYSIFRGFRIKCFEGIRKFGFWFCLIYVSFSIIICMLLMWFFILCFIIFMMIFVNWIIDSFYFYIIFLLSVF